MKFSIRYLDGKQPLLKTKNFELRTRQGWISKKELYMKKALSFLTAGFLLLALAGCGQKGPVIRVAQFMTDPALIRIITEAAADIEKRHPGLRIRVESIPYNQYEEKMATQYAAGNAPDVIFVETNLFVN